ncbi:MAG: thioesterase family protein [Solirubrobacterales bacterium]|nr:thioesterase family protein [Solirubrobacterales bacterium]
MTGATPAPAAVADTAPDAPLFHRRRELFVPTAHTRGPWDPGAMHGGAPTALLAQHLDGLAGERRLARMTFEFLGPVPIAPVRVTASILKPGRNFQLLEGTLSDTTGRPLVLARAVALAPGMVSGLGADAALPSLQPAPSPPQDGVLSPFPAAPGGEEEEGMHRTGMELRYLSGSVNENGPALAWLRLVRNLVDAEAPVPAARVCAAADFGNGISRVVGFDTHVFVNTDLTITLLREPVGPWVLLDATTHIDASGVGWAASDLHDAQGPIGQSHQTLFVRAR